MPFSTSTKEGNIVLVYFNTNVTALDSEIFTYKNHNT